MRFVAYDCYIHYIRNTPAITVNGDATLRPSRSPNHSVGNSEFLPAAQLVVGLCGGGTYPPGLESQGKNSLFPTGVVRETVMAGVLHYHL